MEVLTDIVTWATQLIDSLSALVTDAPITYLVIFGMAAFDVIFPILPSEAVVTAAAVLAGQGRLNVIWVMVAAGIGAFVGDNVAYWIGRAAGRPLVEKVLRGNTSQLEAVREHLHERGGMFVIIGRFVPGGRTVVALGAGVLHFSWPTYLAYDAAAAVIWAIQAALPGFIGGSLIQDRPWLAMLFGFSLSVLIAGGVALVQRRRSGKRTPEVPLRPAVVGIGGVVADIEVHGRDEAGPEAHDGDPPTVTPVEPDAAVARDRD
ncbi:MAG: DedA family protein [Chloroflexota bacterium]|jgi:membrane-associated protein|nr:DedA family protein [Chloroflexota bacterium]